MKTVISIVLATIAMHTEYFWVIGVCLALLVLIHWKKLYLLTINNRKS